MRLRFGRRRRGPLGCLLGCGTAVLVLLCVGGILALVFGLIRSSEAYQMAMTEVTQNEQAISLLGDPIEAGWFITGSISTSGSSGEADFSIPVSGPQASGTLFVQAEKSLGEWQLLQMVLEVNGERVPLLTGR